jgi:transposase
LVDGGIENIVVDSASIEVNRRQRRVKTDRLDAGKLVSMLMRYHGGEKKLWAVVRVPSVADEDARQLHRELKVLKGEKTMHGIFWLASISESA